MGSDAVQAGIIGCGNISGIYCKNGAAFRDLRVTACADMDPGRAEARAREFGLRACTVPELLADPELELVINLTTPGAHAEIALQAIASGKSVYTEKPLALNTAEGSTVLAAAAARGVLVGGAPDTFLGGGLQTCRKLLDDGAIGTPVGGTAFMLCRGHEHWHPDPAFYYQQGGGPMFDMGPYYLTALVSLLGPVRRVTGSARASFPERTIGSQAKKGTVIKVEVPTHMAGVLDFASGAVVTIVTSFDVWAARVPSIEIYGSLGSLSVPDPNGFGGVVSLWDMEGRGWQEVPLTHDYTANSRGLGAADMAAALQSGRPHRASGALTYHVLEIMESLHLASARGRHVRLKSSCERPAPLPLGLEAGAV